MPQGMTGLPNMSPQMAQQQRMPSAPQMPPLNPMPIQSHDNGLLQMLLGSSMNGQNGQALGLLKMLAQMQKPQSGMPPNPFASGMAGMAGGQGMQMPPWLGLGQMFGQTGQN